MPRRATLCVLAILLMPFAAPSEAQEKDEPPALTFTTPKHWKRVKPPPMLTVAGFEISGGQEKALMRISFAGGPVDLNVERWRNQLDLPRLDEAGIAKLVRPIDVGGIKGHYVDLANPKANDPGKTRLLAVMAPLPNDARSYFFTMRGSIDLLEKEKPAFEAFIKSVRFAKEK